MPDTGVVAHPPSSVPLAPRRVSLLPHHLFRRVLARSSTLSSRPLVPITSTVGAHSTPPTPSIPAPPSGVRRTSISSRGEYCDQEADNFDL